MLDGVASSISWVESLKWPHQADFAEQPGALWYVEDDTPLKQPASGDSKPATGGRAAGWWRAYGMLSQVTGAGGTTPRTQLCSRRSSCSISMFSSMFSSIFSPMFSSMFFPRFPIFSCLFFLYVFYLFSCFFPRFPPHALADGGVRRRAHGSARPADTRTRDGGGLGAGGAGRPPGVAHLAGRRATTHHDWPGCWAPRAQA